MNVNREGKVKISVVKSNKTTLKIVKKRTLEETRQYNRKQNVRNPLTMSEFYRDRNMHDPHTSTRCHDYSNNKPFNRSNQFNNNFQSPITTQDWPSHTRDYDYYNRLTYYEYGPNHSNFSPPVYSHSPHYDQYQNQPYINNNFQYQYFKELNCQNNYYAQSLISSNHYRGANDDYIWKPRTLVTISNNIQQQNNKKRIFINEFLDKKQIGFKRPNYQKKYSSVKRTQDRKVIDRYPRRKPIYDISPTTKCSPMKCEIIDLCEEDTNENYPTTTKITNHIQIVSEEIKRKKHSETNAPCNQDLCEIKDGSIETKEKCATNTINIKNGSETVSEKVKRNKNSETYAPNNLDLCEIKDVSIETNEKCATDTIKIKNGTDTVSEKVKRNENSETYAPNNQDLCEIKEVSIETNEKCETNTKIKNGTETDSEKVKSNENSETYAPNNQDLCEIKEVSIETKEKCGIITIKIKNGTETDSEKVKSNENSETYAPNNQDLCEIKDASIETNEKCATNTIKIKNGTETDSEKVKGNKNSETYAPNNQHRCEIKDVSIETNENGATNTIKIKNGTETVSERLKRIDALNIQDLCEINDVSFETNENCPKNTIKIINGTESVSEKVKRKNIPETKSNNQDLFKIKGVSIETQDVCSTQQVCTIQVCSDCKEVFPCNTQQNYEKKIDVTKKIQDTKIVNRLATKNKSYNSTANSLGNHNKTIKSTSLDNSRNKESLEQSMLTRKEKMNTSKFLKASKSNKSDNGSNIFNKDTNNLSKKRSYIDTFSKKKIDASYKIPKLSKYKIEENECNNNLNKISKDKKGVKVIGDVKSTKNIIESRGNSTYSKVKKSENNKNISVDKNSRDEKTINKSKQLKCNNKANKISLEKRGVNVNSVVTSIKNSAVCPKIPKLLKSTETKETSIDKISRSDKVSKRIETKNCDSAQSIHSKLKQAHDKNVNTTDGERDVSSNKDAKEKHIFTNKTKSGDKAISKINSRFSETTKKRKLTVDENIKDKNKKKHKVETGKLTSKTKPAIVKTCNEQFKTSKSLVHVSNDLNVEKPNKRNSRHKSSSRKEKLTKTLKEDREGLLINVDKDKKITVKSNVKDEKHKIKKHTKQKSNLNIIINITYPEKTSEQKCTKETYSVEDLSFLDDFNVDEIVKSLDNC